MKKYNNILLVPVYGIVLFIALYYTATVFYPGGSEFDKQAISFSWMHNYWCNLLSEPALNGKHNPAQLIAGVAMIILCIALSFFWWLFPRYVVSQKIVRRIIQSTGISAMAASLLLFLNRNHDLVTNIASGLGMIATLASLYALYRLQWRSVLVWGLFNLILVVLNNYLYYSPTLIFYLPLVQKITFASFLVWIIILCLKTRSHSFS